MASSIPKDIDTVVIGNGPSALILSYILHGHIPYYNGGHPDTILDSKLSQRPNLLDLRPDIYAHFRSSLRYSTQALPVNTFLDTLIRPNADTDPNPVSCVVWKYEPEKAVQHVVLGQTATAGGQWAENPVQASSDIGTLSYAEMLSLPGYTFSEHYQKLYGKPMPDFVRPTRTQVAEYYDAYPAAVRIAGSIWSSEKVANVSRSRNGFVIGSHGIRCKHIVLASGIFSKNLSPPPQLQSLGALNDPRETLLVVGSGFSAADVIISATVERKILHIFNWDPENRPSPLKGCHYQAYPEYAGVYRQMRKAAMMSRQSEQRPSMGRRKSNAFSLQRNWDTVYEGLPNAEVPSAKVGNGTAAVSIRLESEEIIERTIGEMHYVVGRRGDLDYLSDELYKEVTGSSASEAGIRPLISGRTLRTKAENDVGITKNVFIIGSMAGDSLVRHAYGTCVAVGAKLIRRSTPVELNRLASDIANGDSIDLREGKAEAGHCNRIVTSLDDLQSQDDSDVIYTPKSSTSSQSSATPTRIDHEDLHLDRRKLKRDHDNALADSSPIRSSI